METQTQTLLMLPPEALVTTKNVRFGLKQAKVKSLAESIAAFNGVHTNLKVEPTEQKGVYAILNGHYRTAAVQLLRKKGADILLPCEVVEDTLEGVERLKMQLSENMDRENLSPMDLAHSIKELREAGMEQPAICELFKVTGGTKGTEVRPMSRRVYFLYQSFLKFPKKIQTMIHEGVLTVADAQRLSSKPPEAWDAIVADAEAARAKALEAEEGLDSKFLEEQKRVEEQAQKAQQDAEALAKAQQIAKEKAELVPVKVKEAADAMTAARAIPAKQKELRAKAEEAFKAKEKEAKEAEKAAEEASSAAEKLQQKAEKSAAAADERRKKLEEARAKAVKDAQATAKVSVKGGADGRVKLTSAEMRKYVEDLAVPGFPKVMQIGQSLIRAFDSVITDTELLSELAYITGERKDKPKTMVAAAAPAKKK